MKKYAAVMIAAIAAGALSFTAQANPLPINGGITFNVTAYSADGSGFGNLNPAAHAGVLTVATLSTSPVTGTVDLAPLTGESANVNLPVVLYQAGAAVSGLFFSVVHGGNTWYFVESDQVGGTYNTSSHNGITSSTYSEIGFGWVEELAGINNPGGALLAGGLQDQGTWTFSLSDSGVAGQNNQGGSANASFTFTPIPDGGLTVALLGGALVGLHAVRRKLNK